MCWGSGSAQVWTLMRKTSASSRHLLFLIKMLGPSKVAWEKKKKKINQPLPLVTAVLIQAGTCSLKPTDTSQKVNTNESSAFQSRNSLVGTLWLEPWSLSTAKFLCCVPELISYYLPGVRGCVLPITHLLVYCSRCLGFQSTIWSNFRNAFAVPGWCFLTALSQKVFI